MNNMSLPPPPPRLIDPNTRNFLGDALWKSYVYRTRWTTFAVNFLLATAVFAAVAYYVAYKYKTRPTYEELERRELEKKQRILATIGQFQMERMKQSQDTITGLPNWKNEYESIIRSTPFYR